jgi:hypothetical protein
MMALVKTPPIRQSNSARQESQRTGISVVPSVHIRFFLQLIFIIIMILLVAFRAGSATLIKDKENSPL